MQNITQTTQPNLAGHPLAQFMASGTEDNGFALYGFILELSLSDELEVKLLRHLTGFGYHAFAIYAHQQRPAKKEEQEVFEKLREFINTQELPHLADWESKYPSQTT